MTDDPIKFCPECEQLMQLVDNDVWSPAHQWSCVCGYHCPTTDPKTWGEA